MTLAAAALIAPLALGPAQTIDIDFGNANLQTPGNYNNVTETTTALANLIDSGGTPTGIALDITDDFFNNGPPSQLGTESPMGDAAHFPVTATDDYLFGHTGPFAGAESNPSAGFVFSGLNDALTYDFTFLSSRTGVSDTRDAHFEVSGANNGSGDLNASNNDSQVLTIGGIFPSGGEIAVAVSAGPNNDNNNGFFYLNAVSIEVIPAPGTAAALLAGVPLLVRRRRR